MATPDSSFPTESGLTITRNQACAWLIVSDLLVVIAAPFLLLAALFTLLGAQSGGNLPSGLAMSVPLGLLVLPLFAVISLITAWLMFGRKNYTAATTITTLPVAAVALFLCWWSAAAGIR